MHSGLMKTIAFYNLKGGVGKTSAAVNCAWLAAASGLRTLFWDLDPQGAGGWYLAPGQSGNGRLKKLLSGKLPVGRLVTSTAYEKLDLIPSDLAYRHLDLLIRQHADGADALSKLIAPFGEDYALVVLDCPPSLSDLAEQVFVASDAILLPLVPSPLSLRTFEQTRDFVKEKGLGHKQLYPFFSMVDRRRNLHRNLRERPPPLLKRLLKTEVPYAASVERMGEKGLPLPVFAGNDPATQAYRALWDEIVKTVNIS
ncbi:ParA family protein [Thioalkalivibrio sp. ALJ1]|uniref:ParA family protein n=1 Tax=Thioalkalivibrio sp. ALJ1 TaxID=1158144 RepID=UPI000B17CA6A|nr:ParA family protein [Thioalkalivibrio sp. ALJ1]